MRLLLACLFTLSGYTVFAQNLILTYQNPDALSVCIDDQMSITVNNTGNAPATGVQVILRLPAGIRYVSGTIAGASEQNIANLNAPVFKLDQDLAPGAPATLNLTVHATCALVNAINNGQTFRNTIEARWQGGGSAQVETATYIVETPLLLITEVSPIVATGEAGDILMRTIKVQNTRKGPIAGLTLTDQHIPGLFFELQGVGNPVVSPVQFQANVPGSYFSAFGDGDNLLEETEVATFVQKITVTDCKDFIFTNPSTIRVGWGCDGQLCQYDTAAAFVTIKPTTKNPNLKFIPMYRPPLNQCAETPAVQEVILINNGLAPAENVELSFVPDPPGLVGLDLNSAEWHDGTGWKPLLGGDGDTVQLTACKANKYYKKINLTVPFVPAGDTVWVRFNAYTCSAVCTKPYIPILGAYAYHLACPATEVVRGIVDLKPDSAALSIVSKVYYDIGVCLENNATYNFNYWVKSKRLLETTGYLQVNISIPWGVFWQNNCLPMLDGKAPLEYKVDSVDQQNTTLKLSYALPMSKDSVAGDFCLLSLCQLPPDYAPANDTVPPRKKDFTVYPSDGDCAPCVRTLTATTLFTDKPGLDNNCGFSTCDAFDVVLNCGCDDPFGSVANAGQFKYLQSTFDSWRVNRGFLDDNDDRRADSNAKADPAKIRLDRFLPGDTMRTQLRAVALPGVGSQFGFRIFHESWNSDVGIDGGNPYDMMGGKGTFVNYDQVVYLGGNLVIKTKAGPQHTCPVSKAGKRSDQHLITVAEPNIRPERTLDEGLSMFNEFVFDVKQMAAAGCVPPDFALTPGDSLVFTGDYRFNLNFTPLGGAQPPLINFRSTACGTRNIYAWKSATCTPYRLRQYSGFLEFMRTPVYAIQPCSTALEITPFRYEIRIAKENMFPFEVRRLTDLVNLQHGLPTGLQIQEARLRYLRLQENTNLLSDLVLPYTVSGTRFDVPLLAPLQGPLDEGFKTEIGLTFAPGCNFLFPSSSARTVLRANYANDIFHKPIAFSLDSTKIAYFNNRPNVVFAATDTVVNITAQTASFSFSLQNSTFLNAPNAWLIVDSDGALQGLEVLKMPEGTPLTAIAGVYQLGNIGGNGRIDLRLKADAEVCKSTSVRLFYGWDCQPLTNLSGLPCGSATQLLELKPRFPELELVPLAQPLPLRLCQPSDYFEFEVYNANEGRAFDVLGLVKLPPGLKIVPGSAQLSYPAGSAYVDLPEPQLNSAGLWEWTPELVSQTLRDEGLAGFSQKPNHSLRIRFKVQADCGFVANSQIVFGTEAARLCGLSSNSLRKPGLPLRLLGRTPSYEVTANLKASAPGECGKETTITATVTVSDTPAPGDSLYISMPQGTSYVAGSYAAGNNAPAGPPTQTGQQLRLPLPVDIGVGTTLSFTFKLKYDSPAGCTDRLLTLQAREQASALCNTQSCAVFLTTGEAFLTLPAKNPALTLKDPIIKLQNNNTVFIGSLENTGAVPSVNPVVQIYADLNQNGKADPGEPQVGSFTLNQTLNPGATRLLSGNLNMGNASFCQLIAVIPSSANCTCEDKVIPIGANPVVTTAIGRCKLEPVELKTDSLAGHTYQWVTPNGIACPTCANTTYTPTPDIAGGQLVTLVLEDRVGNCVIERRFEIKFGGQLGSSTIDQTLCKGETLQLEATPGGTYSWTSTPATNFADPKAQIQVVQPSVFTTYRVTVTFPGGCTGSDLIRVTVINAPVTNIQRRTCPGDLVDIFGTPTDEPGTYSKVFTSFRGCDSIVNINLTVPVTSTQATVPLCQGDTIVVLDSVFTKPGTICKLYTTSLGNCDSIHCVTVRGVARPVLPVPDTIVIKQGEEVRLQAPPGLSAYTWTPSTHLSCANCPDPVFQGDTSMVYRLKVDDPNRCTAEVDYRILVFPPCFSRFLIPNAFTPNGDDTNDKFRVVPFEGLETIETMSIYNRWGQLVYTGSGKTAAWDGTIDGEPAPMDVYVWIIEAACEGEKKMQKGHITLLR